MNAANLHLKPPPSNLLSARNPFQIRQFRLYRRRRIKRTANRHLAVCSQLLDPFQNFLSQFPSSTSLDFLAPALGIASGLTLYLSQFRNSKFSSVSYIGEWILFTSPTAFNRFVFLRCPSISFEGSELLEDANQKLVKEDRHFVRLDSGRIHVRESGGGGLEEKLVYQRVCVSTDDGGVISLDWPANLDLTEEHGLDTTLLIVPGTPEGSMEENVRSFVCEALKRGFFPVVMNPRGCAGSPLTSARLFTAADSDDICTAIQFINKARPWTSIMGIGCGYGANMLTKYLAEVGEKTPLTAATCINNPFDLEEATRCSPYSSTLDQKLTGGLIDILRSNKELFQGKGKDFNVEKALTARSVRDFEKAVSMISYGFEEIEDFYSKFSTRGVVGNVKIPVLFIQNDDGTVPLFSTPRSLIAENPFTSLLLCSCMPSRIVGSGRTAISWCQNLSIEWLSAVELGLLKGRHPLLKDVDITFNPSKGLNLVEGRTTGKHVKVDTFFDLTLTDANGYTIDALKDLLEDSNTDVQSRPKQYSHRMELEDESQGIENGSLQQSAAVDAELVKGEIADPIDAETGQVLQTAQVVMNMLDVTMPGILEEEEKKKVLTAVGQGETLMKALQDAVPEDVREKLTRAVSGILHAQQANVKLDGLLGIRKIPAVPSGIGSKSQEKVGGAPNAEVIPKDPSNEIKKADDVADCSDNIQPGSDKVVTQKEAELHSSENLHKSSELSQSQTMSGQQGDTHGSTSWATNDSGNNLGSDDLNKEKAALSSDEGEKALETNANSNVISCTEKSGATEGALIEEHKVDRDGGTPQLEMTRESNNQKTEEKHQNSSTDQSKNASGDVAVEAPSIPESSTDSQPLERDGNDNEKSDNKTVQPVPDQNKPTTSDSNCPEFSVVQALNALTGMDDSTQVAVNSVFGVIEDMITQLEEGNDCENKTQDQDDIEDEKTISEKEPATTKHSSKMNTMNNAGMHSDSLEESPVDEHEINCANPQNVVSTGSVDKEPAENSILYGENVNDDSQQSTFRSYKYEEEIKRDKVTGGKFEADYADKYSNGLPLDITSNPYHDYFQNQYIHSYLISKIPRSKPLDLDTTTALLLDYYPEDGQWKFLEQPGTVGDSIHDVDREDQIHSPVTMSDTDSYIEPSYVVLNTEKQQEPYREHKTVEYLHENVENGSNRLEIMKFVKSIVLDTLRVEIDRKLSADDMKEIKSSLASELEEVANAVSLAIGHDNDTLSLLVKDFSTGNTSEKFGTLQGENIARAISSAVSGTSYLRRVLPVGVIIGSSLAALRKYFDVGTKHDNGLTFNDQTKINPEEDIDKSSMKDGEEDLDKPSVKKLNHNLTIGSNQTTNVKNTQIRERKEVEMDNKSNDSVMVGAVTAALGASALLVQQQDPYQCEEPVEGASKSFKTKTNQEKAVDKVDETVSDKTHYNVVASLAEKAMSVAGPVFPTKEDGEVDQERLVAMLAELGQKGGLMRLVGKVALLWGGIRGAVSLTDKLILFLRMAERPVYQRIIGFLSMVLVLWSPVVIPFLPTLVQSWTTNSPSRFAELVSIVGLYTAVMILVMLWGRRIRGYEDPLEEYGLDLIKLPKIQNLLVSLIGGVMLVLSIQSINAILGCVSFSWPSSLPISSLDGLANLKACGQVIMLAGRGIITAIGVVLVEELLFRAWLPEEIATDLGYHQGIIISGLAFSLLQRSPWAVPGLWLLSLALAGFRQRSQGSLSIPIGLRAGIMASSFILQTGGFLIYNLDYPFWITRTHPFQPFSGVVGIAFSALLAIILYPRQPLQKKKKLNRPIKE